MSEKLVNFRMDEDKYHELKMLALKERIPIKNLVSDLIEDYLKKHGDGNPQFILDQFEDPDFIACPAFYRSANTWESYIQQASTDEKDKIKAQVILIDHIFGRNI
jgi:hypothetical protein